MADIAVSAVLVFVRGVVQALEDVKVNKQTCRRLAEQWRRLQQNLPKLQQNPRNFGQSHRSALVALERLVEDTTAFIAKFNDRSFFRKHWNHEADKAKFHELGTRLDNLIQELQLGILTDTRLFLQNLDRDHDLDLEDIKQQLEGLGAGQGQILEGQAHLAHMLQRVQEQMSRVMHMQPSGGGAMNTVQNEIRGVCGACHENVCGNQLREKDTATGVYRHRDPKDCHVLAAALREQEEREREAAATSVPTPAPAPAPEPAPAPTPAYIYVDRDGWIHKPEPASTQAHPVYKTSGSKFSSDAKYCRDCGQGTTKDNRETCKQCGVARWISAAEIQKTRFITNQAVSTDSNEDKLGKAAREGTAAEVEKLLRMGVNPNGRCTWNKGKYPLHWAVTRGLGSVVGKLLQAGASVNARDFQVSGDGDDALENAVNKGDNSIVRQLLEARANVQGHHQHAVRFCHRYIVNPQEKTEVVRLLQEAAGRSGNDPGIPALWNPHDSDPYLKRVEVHM
eukprot:Tamp_13136.p1 GENE.Tamp_13136~~Tamp_13136.p1  ORF type:complete len:508 (+),score=82.24 Tamp_13136:214-1737(+)